MNIKSDKNIYKVGKRVFLYDKLDFDINLIKDIININDKGSKFIPCMHFNHFHIFKNLLNNFDSSLSLFNRNYIYNKSSLPPSESFNLNISSNNIYSECNTLKCFYNQVKPSRDHTNMLLNEETIDFKFNFYKYVSNLKFEYNHNLTISEISSLFYFSINKPFKVVETDKNVGVCLISNENYNYLCSSLLNDTNTYELINYDPLPELNNEIKIKLDNLLKDKHISKNLYKNLFVQNNKLGSFRILTKLHKEELGLRPIVNCRNHPTFNISMLIDIILKNFVKNSESFILDSQNLIQKLYRSFFPSDSKIFSCDFSSLYTSIDLDDALHVITEFIARNFSSTDISTYGFHTLLKIIFTLNYFRFNDKYFKQVFGISMGNKAAPSVANIYLVIKEENFLVIHRPYILAYYRFIDDIFIIVKNEFNIEILRLHFGYLKLNVVGGKTVNFFSYRFKPSYK